MDLNIARSGNFITRRRFLAARLIVESTSASTLRNCNDHNSVGFELNQWKFIIKEKINKKHFSKSISRKCSRASQGPSSS